MEKLPSIQTARVNIETEFGEPLRAIVTGFIPLGTTRRETAATLGVSQNSLRSFCADEAIHFPNINERRRRGSHFATAAETARRQSISRTRRNRGKQYPHAGRSMSLTDWADWAGLPESTLRTRIKRGLSMTQALAASGF